MSNLYYFQDLSVLNDLLTAVNGIGSKLDTISGKLDDIKDGIGYQGLATLMTSLADIYDALAVVPDVLYILQNYADPIEVKVVT